MSAPDVSIIIVNYNAGDLLRKNLASVARFVTSAYEVIVVDNASSDDSLEGLPQDLPLEVIRTGTNGGFAKGCNVGARAARGRLFHFLNPDAQVTENIDLCYREALNQPESIHITRTLDTRRGGDRSGYPFPTLGNIFRMLLRPGHVQRWYLGASLVLEKNLFWRLGGWSEDYFLYAEDMDLFFKAMRANVKTHQSEATVIHEQGGTTGKIWSTQQRQIRVERSALIFARKFGLRFDYFAFRHLAFLRLLATRPRSAFLELLIYWRVLLNLGVSRLDR